MRRSLGAVLAGVGLLAGGLAGCSEAAGPEDGSVERAVHLEVHHGEGVLFLTQNVEPEAVMDARYEGPVTVDAAGCLRIASSSPEVTVVWPKGYGFQEAGGGVVVTDASGEVVGSVGSAFTLPGGEVPELLDSLGFTAEDRALAGSRCPGGYWVVAGVGSGS